MAADISRLVLEADSSQIKKADRDLDNLEKTSGDVEKSTKKMKDEFSSLGAVMRSVLPTVSFAAALAASVPIHREFTKSVSELSAITGATGNDLKFYREEAMKLGASTTFAASQVVQAFKLVASAKPDLLENKDALASVTKEVLTLAEASGLELPEAAKALGSSLNQFGEGASQATRYINVLAAGAKFGASEIENTAEALKNAGAVASSLGLSFEETNAAIQGLASVSIKGAEAGTGLRGVLLKLSTQSRNEFNPEIVGLTTALKNLEAANLTTTQKAKLFGQESITAATALISQADAVDTLVAKLTGTNTAYEQARVNTDNLDGDIKQMNSSWENAALLLGESFDPALRASVQLLSFFGKVASSVVISIDDMGDAIGAYAAATGALLSGEVDQFKEILKMREAEYQANRKRLDALWEEVDANKVLNEVVKNKPTAGKGGAPVIDEKAIEAARKAEEKRQKSIADTITALEKEFYTTGMSRSELERYNLELLGATDAQKALVEEIVLDIEAKEADIKATRLLAEEHEKQMAIIKRSTDRAMWGAEDAFVNFVKTGKSEIGDLVDTILDEILRLQFRDSFAPALSSGFSGIFGGLFGGGSGQQSSMLNDQWSWMDDIASFFGFANGGIMTSSGPMALNKYASGGIVDRPQVRVAGEGDMNEAIVPLPDGRSIPVNINSNSGMHGNIEINIHEAPGTQASIQQSQEGGKMKLDVIIEQIDNALGKRITTGVGGLNRSLQTAYGLNPAAGAHR